MPSLLPSEKDIGIMISERLKCVDVANVSIDKTLKHAAQLMQLNDCNQIDFGNSNMFMVCEECCAHRVCAKRPDNSGLCKKCKDKADKTNGDRELEKNFFQRGRQYRAIPR